MEQNFASTELPTSASSSALGGASAWSNPSRITADDGSSASWAAFAGGQMSAIDAADFDFPQLPAGAVIDGIEVFVDGSQTGCFGNVTLNISGTTGKDIGALNGSFGGPTDLWGLTSISISDIASIGLSISANDVSGGDGFASIDYVSVTVYWHIEVPQIETDVPTRAVYKVYSRIGSYLGELPNVTSKLAFPEDISSAGTSMVITCGEKADNEVTAAYLLTEAGDIITTEDDLPIVTTATDLLVARGDSDDEVIFKNSNRIKAWLYNKYYPNGRLMFSGQVNAVNLRYGAGDASVALLVLSDGLDLNSYIARGYPFSYTNDVSQTSQNGFVTVTQSSKDPSWQRYGQTWLTGGSVTNIGALVLKLQGTATVTLSVYDAPNGNLIGSLTRSVTLASPTDVQFDVSQLIDVTSAADYFMAVSVAPGQSIRVYKHSTSSTYANGSMYTSTFTGTSGGSYLETSGDFYFITKYGTPTTTATYTSDDPVADMASGIFQDYNDRGGYIKERDFEATGLSLTYTFVMAFIYDALKKILELCPSGYYAYVDVGTAEIDIKQASVTPDFTVVRGRHINQLDLNLTIEDVRNYLLFTGGDTGGGSNLYRDYTDSASIAYYGLRSVARTDNRVTTTPTADAIGDTFIEEEAGEQQNTSLTVLNEHIDITLLTPGKTIGFKNFGNFIDDLVLQVVRRDGNYNDGVAVLTLGRLPVRMNDVVQRLNRQLLNEQTIDNPSAPS